jgi:uncharacterized protein YjbI with pentapeptide repeats
MTRQEVVENKKNLRDADLGGADLSGADLSGADLSYADLSSADLSGADLRSADLRSADLRDADLSGADLRNADLRSADLRSADLRSADLRDADLDFSCWPLWCGSLKVKVDEKQQAQLLYHIISVCKDVAFSSEQVDFANTFHRAGEVPRLEKPQTEEATP